MRELLAEITALLEQNRPCVYCAVVETRGSTPQKAGAAMLVFPDGSQRGTLGGGCVEAEVKQRALRVLALDSDRPELLTFCLDDNYGWDDGLICGGRMTVLADPLHQTGSDGRDVAAYFRHFRELVEEGRGCTEVIALDKQTQVAAGTRLLFDGAARLAASAGLEGVAASAVTDDLSRRLAPIEQRPCPMVHAGFAFLPIPPRITLIIVGGGHVGQAVARLAADVDFTVWVLDDRELYASPERFPTAQRRVVGDIGTNLKQLVGTITPSTYCLIVTRGHNHDEEALYHLAGTPAGYVGMIGSRRKIKLIFEDLRAKGIAEQVLARVHAPLGLPIGSQTVPEIAISIVAELIACRNLGDSAASRGVPAS
jgi:xanthine dehydrogenase accessory factor